jgi:hypothetical protein
MIIPSAALSAHIHATRVAVNTRAELRALAHLAPSRFGQFERMLVKLELLKKPCTQPKNVANGQRNVALMKGHKHAWVVPGSEYCSFVALARWWNPKGLPCVPR